MNYANSDPTSRLASGKWRVRHSAWLLAPLLGLGMFSFVGFVYVALRVRSRKFWIACIIACLGSAAVWLTSGSTESTSDGGDSWSGNVILAVWIGLIVYGFVLNRDYLRWRASRTRADAWYNQPSVTNHKAQTASPPRPEHRIQMQAAPPTGQGVLGVSSTDYYSPPVIQSTASPRGNVGSSGRPVDVNLANSDQLASLPGVDKPLADRVVAIREQQGPFRDVDHMAKSVGLQPHELMRFKGLVTFESNRPAPDAPTTRLPGIRRLDY